MLDLRPPERSSAGRGVEERYGPALARRLLWLAQQILLGPLTFDPGAEERLQESGDFSVGGRDDLRDLPIELGVEETGERIRIAGLGLPHLPSVHYPDPVRSATTRLG